MLDKATALSLVNRATESELRATLQNAINKAFDLADEVLERPGQRFETYTNRVGMIAGLLFIPNEIMAKREEIARQAADEREDAQEG